MSTILGPVLFLGNMFMFMNIYEIVRKLMNTNVQYDS